MADNYNKSQFTREEIDSILGRAAPGGAIDTSLSDRLIKYVSYISPPATAADLWKLSSGMYGWIQTEPLTWEPPDTPTSGAVRVELIIKASEGDGSRTCDFGYIDGAKRLTRYIGESVEPTNPSTIRWAKLATATPPVEFDLPLSEGITPSIRPRYSKDQFGFVHIAGRVSGASNGSLLATLPAGYRPSIVFSTIASHNVSGAGFVVRITVRADGAIVADISEDQAAMKSWLDLSIPPFMAAP